MRSSGRSIFLGKDCLLLRLVEKDSFRKRLCSMVLRVAEKQAPVEVITNETQSKCVRMNAVLYNVAELRDILRMDR